MPILQTIDDLELAREKYIDAPESGICIRRDRKRIPKIIHQTWKTKEVPDHWLSSYEGWIKHHPDYYYVLWTDDMNLELVRRWYPDFLEKYRSFPYNIQRVDAVRTFYLHRYGGIYSDLDIEPLKSIDSYLDTEAELVLLSDIGGLGKWKQALSKRTRLFDDVFRSIEQHGRYTNMLMASQPGSEFWDRVVNRMMKPRIPWWAGSYHFYIMVTTGPFVIDDIAKQYTVEYPGSIEHFPYETFQPCTICDDKPCSQDDSYLRMLEGSSWGNLNSRIVTTCACNWDLIAVVVILIIVAVLIWGYFGYFDVSWSSTELCPTCPTYPACRMR